jgi:sirohydrochlorin ferrochelatase
MTSPLVLVAHGSRDIRSPATVRRLAAAVRHRWDGPVVPAFLDFNLPAVPPVLRGLGGGSVVVPALLTQAYHGRVDVPEVLASAGVSTRLAPVLGPAAPGEEPDPLLLAALRRRVDQLTVRYDGVALLAAGTRDEAARATVDASAEALERALGVPCLAAYAAGARPTGEAAVAGLRALGARRVVGAAYFLAPGFLYDRVAASALAGGALAVAAPLGDAPELADLVVARARQDPRDLGPKLAVGGAARN